MITIYDYISEKSIHHINIYCFFATAFEILHILFICLYVFKCDNRYSADGQMDSGYKKKKAEFQPSLPFYLSNVKS